MTTDVRNDPAIRESLTNRPNSSVTLHGRIVVSQIALSGVVEAALEDALDDALLIESIERQGDRPFSSYRSLEELMNELGD